MSELLNSKHFSRNQNEKLKDCHSCCPHFLWLWFWGIVSLLCVRRFVICIILINYKALVIVRYLIRIDQIGYSPPNHENIKRKTFSIHILKLQYIINICSPCELLIGKFLDGALPTTWQWGKPIKTHKLLLIFRFYPHLKKPYTQNTPC